jgi:hypothetical protein
MHFLLRDGAAAMRCRVSNAYVSAAMSRHGGRSRSDRLPGCRLRPVPRKYLTLRHFQRRCCARTSGGWVGIVPCVCRCGGRRTAGLAEPSLRVS